MAIDYDRHREDIRSTMIDTVKIYDPDFDDDVELSWRLKMGPGIDYMIFQYDK